MTARPRRLALCAQSPLPGLMQRAVLELGSEAANVKTGGAFRKGLKISLTQLGGGPVRGDPPALRSF